jgi:hypothetical protein
VCVFNSHLSLFDSQDTPRSVAQLKDVTLKTLDREVFINRSDHKFAWFEYDRVISCIRNRATRCNRRQTCASSSAKPFIDSVVMEIS